MVRGEKRGFAVVGLTGRRWEQMPQRPDVTSTCLSWRGCGDLINSSLVPWVRVVLPGKTGRKVFIYTSGMLPLSRQIIKFNQVFPVAHRPCNRRSCLIRTMRLLAKGDKSGVL